MATAVRPSRAGLCKILKLLEASRLKGDTWQSLRTTVPGLHWESFQAANREGAFEEPEELGVPGFWIGGEKIQGSVEEAEGKEEAKESEPWQLVNGLFFLFIL